MRRIPILDCVSCQGLGLPVACVENVRRVQGKAWLRALPVLSWKSGQPQGCGTGRGKDQPPRTTADHPRTHTEEGECLQLDEPRPWWCLSVAGLVGLGSLLGRLPRAQQPPISPLQLSGTSERPRLAVFKSNQYLYTQASRGCGWCLCGHSGAGCRARRLLEL